jgi:hypothetical protein
LVNAVDGLESWWQNFFMKNLLLVLFIAIPCVAFAEPSEGKVIAQKNSKCSIESTSGEYPLFRVKKGKEVIYAPKSDGIVNALISPSGKYVALAAGEVDLLQIESGKTVYGVVLVNCNSGKKAGFLKDKPASLKEWKKDSELALDSEILMFGKGASSLPK